MKKILVLGYTGQLGSALTNEFCNNLELYEFIGLNSQDIDITNFDEINSALDKYKPDVVINTVAYTNVEHAEIEPRLAYELNVFGTENVAKACLENKSNLVHISTDYVFGVRQQKVINEYEDPNPLNHYGMSKLAGELIVSSVMKHSDLLWHIVRSSSLYGRTANASKGTFLLKMLNRLKHHHDIHLNDDHHMSPTSVVDLSSYIANLLSKESGIYHAVNYGTATPYSFIRKAVEIIHRNKLSSDYSYENIIKSQSLQSKVNRPRFSFIGSAKSIGFKMPTWEEALENFLIENKELL